jgi:hypothetical protein
VEVHVLAIQARVMLWVVCAWLLLGLWLGYDPATVAWRAAIGGCVATWLTGKLLHIALGVISERLGADLAERQVAAEQAAKAAIPQPRAARPRAGA